VFISYSHDSEEHAQRVLELAQQLRRDGIDAWLDLFEPAPPQGWPRWMRDQIDAAEFIVLVCTETFRERFEGRGQAGEHRGVTFEGLVTECLVYDGELDHARVVPVLLDAASDAHIPRAARVGTHHRLPAQYEQLRKRLIGRLAVEPEPLGEVSVVSRGLPPKLSPADQLSLLQDELERREIAGEDTAELLTSITVARRELRSGPTLDEGDILGQRYRFVEQAGVGGFASVWKAYDRKRKRLVAVKILHGQWSEDRSRIERFVSGARQMDKLEHETIVPVLDVPGEDEGRHFCVMKWLEGGNLRHAITRGTTDRQTALVALACVLDGLAHAHAHGVVHRDVKPDNILLDADGRGYLTDFDLAHARDSTHGTRTGGMGTFVYAAPEQLRDAKSVDARADVYGVGMCLIFALTGSDPPPVVARVQPDLVDALDCGAQLRAAIGRAVAYECAKRASSCAELAQAVRDEVARAVELTLSAEQPPWAADFGTDDHGWWAAFRIDDVEFRMRWIPPGSFMMGAPASDDARRAGEGYPRPVSVTQGFWMAETPCSQAQWQVIMGHNPSQFAGATHPVESVSWAEAMDYVERLQRAVGPGFALPTEVQWEYACRAGTTGRCYGPLRDVAWFQGNTSGTWELGRKQVNPWGLYDMLGNVWEWCADVYVPHDDGSPEQPNATANTRVIRGGSWFSPARMLRASCRNWLAPSKRTGYLGFRLVQNRL
jgi:formylglycine-generating enzyme required for sulfatase activity